MPLPRVLPPRSESPFLCLFFLTVFERHSQSAKMGSTKTKRTKLPASVAAEEKTVYNRDANYPKTK